MATVAVTAGSAIFNIVVIPALVIVAVTMFGRKAKYIKIQKNTVIRDGAFLLIAELLMIFFLGLREITWWVSAVMVITYVIYFYFLRSELKAAGELKVKPEEVDDLELYGFLKEHEEDSPKPAPSRIKRVLTLDMYNSWFKGKIT